ncbi:sensor histidine kinase [Paenibacillus sp. NPDC058071]|uniref:sensor histidine kinase n=1 Tax=Paenibacillus sp. NPDC058071 TaxID=3346326 RepID=UPI0036DCB6FF
MKLRRKIYFYSSVLFAGLLIAANVTVYYIFSDMTINKELGQLTAESQQAADAIRKSDTRLKTEELLRAYVPLDGMIAIVPEEGSGKALLVTSPSETALSSRGQIFDADRRMERVSFNGNSYGFLSLPIIQADGGVANVQVHHSLEKQMALLHLLRLVLIGVSIVITIIALLSSALLGRLIMRPIAAMTGTMREIIRSGKFVRLEQEGDSKDELKQMGETFNEMIDLLENSFAKQEQFVSNASHELKTPLTIIESYSSLLKRKGIERPELFHESVEAIHSEAVRMKGMTEQLLLLAAPHRYWSISIGQVELLPFTEQTVSGFKRAYGRGIDIEHESDTDIIVSTDPDKLKQLLFIFLDNARKYSEKSITVKLGTESSCTNYLSVTDYGIGIPANELPRVFDRFYRVDEARSRNDEQEGGAGLGLAMAKEIAHAIGVRLALDSVEGEGTTATIYFDRRS